jgi:hypothetical protein
LRRNFSQRTHLIHSIGPKSHILGHFGLFCYGTKLDATLTELAPLTPKFGNEGALELFATNAINPLH